MLRFNIVIVLLVLELVPLEASLTKKTEKWSEFKTRFRKTYRNESEEVARKAIYESKLLMVQEWNADPANSFKLALNEFADETAEEIATKRTGLKRLGIASSSGNLLSSSLKGVDASSFPKKLTYVGTSLVSSVKNQGNCGSCWAFAVTQAVEAQAVKAFGRMVSPSDQQLVDCDTNNYGCDGGYLEYAFAYMASGMQNYTTYPYKSASSGVAYSCSAVSSRFVVSTKTNTYPSTSKTSTYGKDYGSFVAIPDTGNGDLTANYLNLTIAALNEVGPLTIGVCVGDLFDSYDSGLYTTSRCTNSYLNHAVLLVGYDRSSSDSSKHYWIVKNQWGTSWGENGYIIMQMGVGLIRESMYPVLNGGSSSTTTTKTTARTTTVKTTTRSTTAKTTARTTTVKTTTRSTTAKTTARTTTVKTTTRSTTSRSTTAKRTSRSTTRKTTTIALAGTTRRATTIRTTTISQG